MNVKTNISQSRSLTADLETFPEILAFMKSGHCTPTSIRSKFLGKYGSIKATIHFLSVMADFDSSSEESSLPIFKEASLLLQKCILNPLIKDFSKDSSLSENSEIMVKWWVSYFSILHEAYEYHSSDPDRWKGDSVWINESDLNFLQQTFKALQEGGGYHWEMMLVRCLCLKEHFIRKILPDIEKNKNFPYKFHDFYENLLKYESILIKKEIDAISLKRSKGDLSLDMTHSLLSAILHQLDLNNEVTRNSLLSGYFPKRKVPSLAHSVLFGDDGGHYAFINSVTEEEYEILWKIGFLKEDYLQRISKQHPVEQKKRKIVIGKGSFGIIRLCLTISSNQTSDLMKPGLIV